MMQKLMTFLNYLWGLDVEAELLTTFHLINRISVIYFLGILLVRFQRQFMGMRTPFNYMISFVIGSVLAAGVVGRVSFLAVLGMALFILSINYLLALLSFYSPTFARLIKGTPELLVKNGQIQWDVMKRNLITLDELMDSVHRLAHTDDIKEIEKAYFENSARITVIARNKKGI